MAIVGALSEIGARAEEARMRRIREQAVSDFEIEKKGADFEVRQRLRAGSTVRLAKEDGLFLVGTPFEVTEDEGVIINVRSTDGRQLKYTRDMLAISFEEMARVAESRKGDDLLQASLQRAKDAGLDKPSPAFEQLLRSYGEENARRARQNLPPLQLPNFRTPTPVPPPCTTQPQRLLEGRKDDTAKDRFELLPGDALRAIVVILTFGAAKYGDRNWEKGMKWSRVYGALQRHLNDWWQGEALDAETGKSHLAHAGCCLLFLIAYEIRAVGEDDRPKAQTSTAGKP